MDDNRISSDQRGRVALNRRSTLGLAALAAGSTAALAACGSEGTPTATSPASPEDSGNGFGDASGFAKTSEVPVGGGVIVAAERLVVTQPTEGEFKAFDYICTHAGCAVSQVEAENIICACHGSRFSIEDGSVNNGPAREPLAEVSIGVDGEDISRS